jgi:HEAT repeat protein
MLNQLINALVQSRNQAADDLLLQALSLGAENEQRVVLELLLKRKSSRAMSGIVAGFDRLPESLQSHLISNARQLHHALAECGRSNDPALRLSAMRLIAAGRQGKLAYVLSENLHNQDEALSKAATDAIVALAKWVAGETRRLQRGVGEDAGTRGRGDGEEKEDAETRERGDGEMERAETGAGSEFVPVSPRPPVPAFLAASPNPEYERLMIERPEIEAAVARALNVHRGKHGADLLRAALLLADWPGSQTLAILQAAKHGGKAAMSRRLQQPPDSENVAAFLLGATHGQAKSQFVAAISHIDHAPVLDALLGKTHWLKDAQLQAALHPVTRGTWWALSELRRDLERRGPAEAASVAEWLACSGLHDVEQDERLALLIDHAARDGQGKTRESVVARLRMLRIAMRRKRGASVEPLRTLLADPDERIVRMAARELVRRKPADFENTLLKLMTSAAPALRRVIGRAIGQAGFEGFWQRFDRLDKSTRKQAGKAMIKLLPDALQRLQRRSLTGTIEHRVKALQIIQELGVAESMREALIQLCADPNPRIRSKAVTVLGEVPTAPSTLLIDKLMNDTDARVRANAVEVMEGRGDPEFIPALTQQALAATGRERANAIKAMHRMKVGMAGGQLLQMLRDGRAEHRISALWALRQIGWWQLLNEVGRLARADDNVRVRRYALGVLKTVSELLEERKKEAG